MNAEIIDSALDLVSWISALNWDGGSNDPEYLAEVQDRINAFTKECKKLGIEQHSVMTAARVNKTENWFQG